VLGIDHRSTCGTPLQAFSICGNKGIAFGKSPLYLSRRLPLTPVPVDLYNLDKLMQRCAHYRYDNIAGLVPSLRMTLTEHETRRENQREKKIFS